MIVALGIAAALICGVGAGAWFARRKQLSPEQQRYTILEAISDGVFIVDDDWRFTHVNERAEHLLRSHAGDLIGRRIDEVLDALASDLVPEMKAARATGVPLERTQYFHANASWMEIRIQPAEREIVVYLRDVTARKRAELRLRESEQRLQLLLGQVPAVVWTVDLDMRFESLMGAGLAAQGLDEDELLGKRFEVMLADAEAKDTAVASIRRVFSGESARFETRRKDRWLQHKVEPLRDANGAILGAIGVALDITEIKDATEHFRQLARIDPLTQLPNRLALQERLEESLLQAVRRGVSVGVLFIDLDRFKNINDTLGHRAGDLLLREFAARVQNIVDRRGTLFRSGGDEFIIVSDLSDTLSVPMIAADIQGALREPFFVMGRELQVSVSIGTSTFPDGAKSADELITHADVAMYRAKQLGRNSVKSFDPVRDTGALHRLRLEQDLHRALARKEIDAVFQPIVSLSTGEIVGAEALMRWAHGKLGPIPPDQFIGIAEETGVITELSRWMLERACRHAAGVRSRGLRSYRVAVNLSPRDFNDPSLIDSVREALVRCDLTPDALDIEITEGTIMHEQAMEALEGLRDLGVRVVLDDFGVQYSSLGYLKRLPVDTVKIDRGFMRDIATDAYNQAIVRAVSSLAKTLHLSVIAEGVEEREQVDFVARLGVGRAQGFFFARPLSEDALHDMLDRAPGFLSG